MSGTTQSIFFMKQEENDFGLLVVVAQVWVCPSSKGVGLPGL